MQLSVAICTRNPRPDYLARVLNALAEQTLPNTEWELLVVDSASTVPLPVEPLRRPAVALRLLRVEQSGLLRARFAAIAAAVAPVVVFLDDDNVPATDFLETGVAIGAQWPMLGCWGPGRIVPECEIPPPTSLADHFGRMACCDLPADRWSNTLEVVPPGAGLFVRLACARAYAAFAEHDPNRQLVGETAERFFRGDDTDLVFHLIKSGFGAGQFTALYLTHLMPSKRLTEDYVVSLAKVAAGSAVVINHLWGAPAPRESQFDRLVYTVKSLRFRGLTRRIAKAHRVGEAAARLLLRNELR